MRRYRGGQNRRCEKRPRPCAVSSQPCRVTGKKVWWHTLFGRISVIEPVLRGRGSQVRPFLRMAEVTARRCSLPVPRALTDFGADYGFGHVPKKLQEQYGITLGVRTVRKITERQGAHMREQQDRAIWPVSTPGCQPQVGEMAGSRVPIVTSEATAKDKRKHKSLQWQEVRLALVPAHGSVTPKFAATFGGRVEESGQAWRSWAVAAGFGTNTQLPGGGDGAVWIAKQFAAVFGAQASYLVDFYQVCDYLAAASKTCAPDAPHAWLETQKRLLNNKEGTEVLHQLGA